jgi:hypothetical protein
MSLAHSVRQRLLNLSRETTEPFDLILTRYALERLLYRISRSKWKSDFLLKGAMLFSTWHHWDFADIFNATGFSIGK